MRLCVSIVPRFCFEKQATFGSSAGLIGFGMSTSTDEKSEQSGKSGPAALLGEFREAQSVFYKTWGPALGVMFIGFVIAWFFVEPAPPSHLMIAAGPKGGAYYAQAEVFRRHFAENGIELKILETAGSLENYQLLRENNEVHLAIVQGGTKPSDLAEQSLESLASLYLEPLWIFSKRPGSFQEIRDLNGQSIAIGNPSSGTEAIMKVVLQANGMIQQEGESDTRVVARGGEAAIEMVKAGEVDAACFVLPPENNLIRELMGDSELKLLPFVRHRAYHQLYPYLSDVTLVRGVLDLERDIPPQDIPLIAPAANLVAAAELHDAFVPLLIEAADRNRDQSNLLASADEFPSLKFSEFRPHAASIDYFKSGHSLLYRYLPFWVASLFDRMKIMLLPLLTLTIPLIKIAPPVYRWRIRSRIYRWYVLLREMDQQVEENHAELFARQLKALQTMESELETIKVPLSYMEEFYNLQLHLELVKRKIEQRADQFKNR